MIEQQENAYLYETTIGSGQEPMLDKVKFSACFERFTVAGKRRGMDVGLWKWRGVVK
ncbi:hypothetical protein [Listeria cornellensis]|uniref:hypothetical protein n=1 Tax=Listeria cornellensis TaxID=1494961 RepID=UPI0019D3C548|nr:hypothetical protein [Listeria cornellensis]